MDWKAPNGDRSGITASSEVLCDATRAWECARLEAASPVGSQQQVGAIPQPNYPTATVQLLLTPRDFE